MDSLQMLSSEEKGEIQEEISDSESVSDRTYDDYSLQWQSLSHSCLLIGWGFDEETQMKYWNVRNSYGPDWGEDGNFRVRRGVNDYGCEGEASAIIPVLI